MSEGRPRKVLIHEAGRTGHRETMLLYVLKALKEAGIASVVHREVVAGNLTQALQKKAADEGCDAIYLLTIDGLTRRLLQDSLSTRPKIPVFGNYYLYNNFRKFGAALGWKWLFLRGMFEKVLVSDETSDGYRFGLARKTAQVVDAWDADDFKLIEMHAARSALRLDLEKTIFLVFGALDARKGVGRVLDAFSEIDDERALLLLVGKPAPSVIEHCGRLPKEVRDRVTLESGYVAEADVSSWFCAADYVVTSYPADFLVSSGTFTRACAAGKPSIVAGHGRIGRLVARQGCGHLHGTESVPELRQNFLDALAEKGTEAYAKKSLAATGLAAQTEAGVYRKQVVEALRSAPYGL